MIILIANDLRMFLANVQFACSANLLHFLSLSLLQKWQQAFFWRLIFNSCTILMLLQYEITLGFFSVEFETILESKCIVDSLLITRPFFGQYGAIIVSFWNSKTVDVISRLVATVND